MTALTTSAATASTSMALSLGNGRASGPTTKISTPVLAFLTENTPFLGLFGFMTDERLAAVRSFFSFSALVLNADQDLQNSMITLPSDEDADSTEAAAVSTKKCEPNHQRKEIELKTKDSTGCGLHTEGGYRRLQGSVAHKEKIMRVENPNAMATRKEATRSGCLQGEGVQSKQTSTRWTLYRH